MFDVITTERWHEIADCFIIQRRDYNGKNEYISSNNFHRINEKNCIISFPAECRSDIFRMIDDSKYYHILIMHSGVYDYSVENDLLSCMPSNVIRLYSVNCMIESDRIIPIPIGIRSRFGGVDFKYSDMFNNPMTVQVKKTKIFACYLSHGNLDKIHRGALTEMILNNPNCDVYNQCDNAEFYQLMNMYKFIVCPFGVGYDTHRQYEAIYCGGIPIVQTTKFNEYMSDLPIVIVDDLLKINYQSFFEQYDYDSIIKESSMDKVNFWYWADKIIQDYRSIGSYV